MQQLIMLSPRTPRYTQHSVRKTAEKQQEEWQRITASVEAEERARKANRLKLTDKVVPVMGKGGARRRGPVGPCTLCCG
jgi:hypothetical protein